MEVEDSEYEDILEGMLKDLEVEDYLSEGITSVNVKVESEGSIPFHKVFNKTVTKN